MSRIEKRFEELKQQGRKGLVTFIMACDPDLATCETILKSLPESGADFIELGMPFSDPMADGPVIQEAAIRALNAEGSMKNTLKLVRSFRENDASTPIILMGYFNPIYNYGTQRFAQEAKESGVDGIIVVDVPSEEQAELLDPLSGTDIDLIKLVTPTSKDDRLETILEGASGFLYYVSITGITGTASANHKNIETAVSEIRKKTDLPVAIGFGIKTPDDAAKMSQHCDAVVVGSSIVDTIGKISGGDKTVQDVSDQVKALADALAA